MGFFKKKVHGYIEYYHLQNWWEDFLSDEERKSILNRLSKKDNGISLLSVESLIKSKIISISASKVQLVASLIESGFDYPKMNNSIEKIVSDIEQWNMNDDEIMDLHFLYFSLAKRIYKKKQEGSSTIEDTIKYCIKSIKISEKVKQGMLKKYPKSPLPSHYCYKQLISIFEEQNKYIEAINLCKKANKQGWAGVNWEEKINKIKKRI